MILMYSLLGQLVLPMEPRNHALLRDGSLACPLRPNASIRSLEVFQHVRGICSIIFVYDSTRFRYVQALGERKRLACQDRELRDLCRLQAVSEDGGSDSTRCAGEDEVHVWFLCDSEILFVDLYIAQGRTAENRFVNL